MSALRRKERASRLYATLAMFDLACVLAGVVFCQALVQGYRHSVEISRKWAERSAQADALARTARDANAPRNELLAMLVPEVAVARTKLAEVGAAYLRESARARTGLADLPTSELRLLAQHLERANVSFDAMLIEAEGLFAAFDRADHAQAGRHMAAMDRQHAVTSHALGELARAESALQRRALAEQATRAGALERWTWVLVALVALLCALAIGHGRLLPARFRAARERRHDRARDRSGPRPGVSFRSAVRGRRGGSAGIVAASRCSRLTDSHRGRRDGR